VPVANFQHIYVKTKFHCDFKPYHALKIIGIIYNVADFYLNQTYTNNTYESLTIINIFFSKPKKKDYIMPVGDAGFGFWV